MYMYTCYAFGILLPRKAGICIVCTWCNMAKCESFMTITVVKKSQCDLIVTIS